tara:strand:+ start:165 stop:443 length:279 start_codon:yes stop_codon:yes gene_type:complete
MSNTEGMWEEPIAELKIGGINGISFRSGQQFGRPTERNPIAIHVKEIRRELDELDEEIFLVFAKYDNKGPVRLIKAWKGKNFYVTFDSSSKD